MKRSEMVESLNNAFNRLNVAIENGAPKTYPGEVLLNLIERQGMLPPPIRANTILNINDDGIIYEVTYKFRPDENTGDHISNWEPED